MRRAAAHHPVPNPAFPSNPPTHPTHPRQSPAPIDAPTDGPGKCGRAGIFTFEGSKKALKLKKKPLDKAVHNLS
jgi:hypothetical protein